MAFSLFRAHIFRNGDNCSMQIAAPSTDALKRSSWYRIRVTQSARSAGLRWNRGEKAPTCLPSNLLNVQTESLNDSPAGRPRDLAAARRCATATRSRRSTPVDRRRSPTGAVVNKGRPRRTEAASRSSPLAFVQKSHDAESALPFRFVEIDPGERRHPTSEGRSSRVKSGRGKLSESAP